MGMSCGVSSNFINRINASFSSELTTPTAIPFFLSIYIFKGNMVSSMI